MSRAFRTILIATVLGVLSLAVPVNAKQPLLPVTERFKAKEIEEVPSFQRHVIPLVSRMGCNARACHGSFQGRGGFRLSLFGYDFKADHDAMLDEESPRIDLADPAASLVLAKPTDEFNHEGGKRYDRDGWEYRLLSNWINAGAPFDENQLDELVELVVTPSEIIFSGQGKTEQLTVMAVWKDGSEEDVTPLCRFITNNEQVAQIDGDGRVTAGIGGDTHLVVCYDKAVKPIPVLQPVSRRVGKKYARVPTPTRVDELVVEKLRKLGIVPSELSSDEEFLRRLRLDLTGTLPSVDEIQEFLADKSASKRDRKIDELLETPGYAAWWTQKLCDFTGNNDQQLTNATPMRGRASQEWYDWIYARVVRNVGYDKLASGIVTATSRPEGMDYTEFCQMMSSIYRPDSDTSFADLETMPHYWARRDFRQPAERAIGFAHAFLGVRIQCAQCHKHPFDQWSKQDFAEFSRFFTGVVASSRTRSEDRPAYDKLMADLGLKGQPNNQLRREFPRLLAEGKTIPFPEVYTISPRIPQERGQPRRTEAVSSARLLGDQEIVFQRGQDVRQPLMEWLGASDNPYFARAFVNRVWASYFNVGIVDPPDDMSLANPASNKPLLDYLAAQFIAHDFDMKWLHREIAGSRTYQLSWRTNETNSQDNHNFSHAVPRRLPAEVIYDALVQATASDSKVQQLLASNDGRTIALAASSQRYQQRSAGTGYAMMVFGRSTRETSCDCDRSDDPTLLQTVYLQNDRDLHALIDRRRDGWLDQLASENGLQLSGNLTPQQQPPANYAERFEQIKVQIARLKKAGNVDQVKRLKRNLQTMIQRFGDPSLQESTTASEGQALDTERLVTAAYLRTLSRNPNSEELLRSVEFVESSDDKMNGLRGLLWALLNTKEFVVNH